MVAVMPREPMVTLRTAVVVWLAIFACTAGITRAALAEPAPLVIDCDEEPETCADILAQAEEP